MDTIQRNVTGRAPGASLNAREPMSIDPEELIDSIETAKLLRLRPQTLATWRAERRGPPYVKVGRHCYYRRADIHHWLGAQLRDPASSTAA
jgi:hypothetical protein